MWTAATLWTITIAGVALYASWAAPALERGVPLWAVVLGALAIYLALVAASLGVYFAIAWVWRSPRPPLVTIGARKTLRLVWREYRALSGAATRMMFYRLLLKAPRPGPAALPILLLHGVLCNAGVWERFARHLRREGVDPVYTLVLRAAARVDRGVRRTDREAIDRILAETGARELVVVSHSMGGLVALAYCRRYGAAKVRRAIALGAPHHGSMHAWLMFGASSRSCALATRGSTRSTRRRSRGRPITSIWSWHDSMVAPQHSSRLARCRDVVLIGVGHNAHPRRRRRARARRRGDPTPSVARAPTSGSPASAERTPSAPP